MDRGLLLSLCCAALMTLGCQSGRQAGLDPFNGRQRVPPPGTGAVGGDPYLSGSSAAPAASGGVWPFNSAPAAPAPAAPANPWPTTAGTAPPAWNGAPAPGASSPSWWPSTWFNRNPQPTVSPPGTGYPSNASPPAGYPPANYPAGAPFRGSQASPAATPSVVPATYHGPPAGMSDGWRAAAPAASGQ